MSTSTIFFDRDKLLKVCGHKARAVYSHFKAGKFKDYPGFSFILNPKPLLQLPDVYILDIVEYINVASYRNYFDYKFNGCTSLPLDFIDFISYDKLKNNRLLKIVGREIHFKYEEKNGS